MTRSSLRSVLLFVFAVLLIPLHGRGQTLYPGFKFDTTFYFGAHFDGYTTVNIARDSLHLDFSQIYHGPRSLTGILDSTRWDSIGSDYRWLDSLSRIFFTSCAAKNLKLIYAPGDIGYLTNVLHGCENYFYSDPSSINTFNFRKVATPSSVEAVPHYPVSAGKFLKSTSTVQNLEIARWPRFTRTGLIRTGYYDLLGYPDSSNVFDLTITMKVSVQDLLPLDSNDVIAYVILSRRDTAGQNRPNTCHCNFYTRFDSIPITKATYGKSPIDPNSGFRDVTLSFSFPTSSVVAPEDIEVAKGVGETVLAVAAGDTLRADQPPSDGWLSWGSGNNLLEAGCKRFCAQLWNKLMAIGVLDANNSWWSDTTGEEADFQYSVFTKQNTDLTFLRGRVSGHLYSLLQRNDPNLDTLINRNIDSIFMDPILDTLLIRFGVVDEPSNEYYPAYRAMASRVARRILHQRPNDTRGLWSNPVGFYGSFRTFTGDLDTTAIKMVHMTATQAYHIGGAIPITYANPDSMAEKSINSYYEMAQKDELNGSDTLRHRFIMANSAPDYNHYTQSNQSALSIGQAELTDGIETSRTRYNYVGRPAPSYPVYDVVQVQGWLGKNGPTGHFENTWRPTSPEEITAQSWLALHCGVDGIVFSDFTFDGTEFGVMHWLSGDHTTEYDTVSSWHISHRLQPDSIWRLPKMWLGFNSRYNAVKSVIETFRNTILPVYTKLDHLSPTRMELHSGTKYFRDMPMLDTVLCERADQYDRVIFPFKPTYTYDPRNQAYMEISHFKPGPQLATEQAAGVQYLMFTNRRCWPIDFKKYNTNIIARFDSVAQYDAAAGIHTADSGFGNIDVRRPVIFLKNSSGVIADSFKIQRVGSGTVITAAIGDTVRLDWLKPGWGALYKITPIPAGISTYGTAFNNAVRSENPSTDTKQRDRIIVYERDSIVYLRTLDSNGTWSKEWMISDAADTNRGTGTVARHTAENINPAVATSRLGNSCLVVWERRDATGNCSPEAAFFNARPVRGAPILPAKTRLRLGAQRIPPTGYNLTPAVTSVDSGYVVAWAAPKPGIEVVALRDKVNPTLAADVSNVSSVFSSNVTVAYRTVTGEYKKVLDSVCQFPTLAYYRNYMTSAGSPTVPQHFAHLAFQQGSGIGPFIMYKPVGARFGAAGKPVLYMGEGIEHVSRNLISCTFQHPSIAVDSLRVGVAFETMNVMQGLDGMPSTRRAVVLRIRDQITPSGARVGMMWNTPAYYWGDSAADHVWPSLTEFPNLRKSWMAQHIEGALTWMRSPGPSGTSQQRFYRYGEKTPSSLPDGKYPTMMLAPFDSVTPLAASGTFYRGDDPSKFLGTRKLGGTAWYYPGVIENTPKSPNGLFQGSGAKKGQIFGFTAFGNLSMRPGSSCSLPTFFGGVGVDWFVDGWGSTSIDTASVPSGVNPAFFRAPDSSGTNMLDTVSKAWEITRTATFRTDTTVKIRRVLWGADSLFEWLNTSAYDTVHSIPANIISVIELVRASDNAVLWTSDTVSARRVGIQVLDEQVEVPVNLYASSTVPVYVRMRMVPTANLEYDLSGGYHFIEDSTQTSLAKVVRYDAREHDRTTAVVGSSMTVTVVPNPLRADGELRLHLTEPGTVSIRIFDMMGRMVRALPAATVGFAGDYSTRLDLSDLPNGRYSVQVESGAGRATTQFVIVR